MKISFITEGVSGGTDTNTNLANTDLTQTTAERTYIHREGGLLKFNNSEDTEIMRMTNDTSQVSIGGASSNYKMPTARADAQYKSLVSTDTSGGLGFQAQTISQGAAFVIMSGGVAKLNGTNYLFFKKNGGTGLEGSSLTIGAANLSNLEMQVWDGNRVPTAFRFVGIRDAAVADGCSLSIFHGTPNTSGTTIALTEGADLATGLMSTNTANFQTASGTIAASDYSGMAAGDFYLFGLQNINQDLDTLKVWITIYFSDVVKY
jgi:hypothetical protein